MRLCNNNPTSHNSRQTITVLIMPTPVAAAKQCLTPEADQALEEAVEVARRRGHAQTTSLHLVASLLALPSSTLREACSRTRNNAYSTRIQFKALDLCLGVSLDRLPSSSKVEEPPVSNSLMAAIKRSQANQRRQPENLQFYHPHLQKQQYISPSSSSSSVSMVKVELQNLIISILDDPVVSRVFGESGFRSCEIKIAILRPVHQLFRYSRYRGPPMFLCNLGGADNDPTRREFNFSYAGFSGVLNGEENCRSIGEIMARVDGRRRNPLLVGVGSNEALRSFSELVQRRRERAVLPVELAGLGVVCIENEVVKFVKGESEERLMQLRFEEIDRMVDNCIGPGVVVNFGNLKAISGHDDDASCLDALRFVVWEMAKLLENHGGKVWLIGSASRYETYLKFLNMFPSVEKDLELQLLPITASRFSTYPRSSLMESFVPFGGFFSTPGEAKTAIGCLDQSPWRLHNDKFDEVNVVPNGANHRNQSGLSSWGKSSPFATDNGSIIVKARGDNSSQMTSVVGFQVLEDDGKTKPNNDSNSYTSKGSNMNSQISGIENQGLCSPPMSSNSSSFRDGFTSPTSIKSPTIDLNLGINNICTITNNGHEPDFKTLYKALVERIGRQQEALQVISHTIAHHRMTNENRHGINRGDIWLHLVGPDKLAKREIANVLAEFHGSRGNLIRVDMSDGFDTLYRGRNLVDNIANNLCKNPFSVLLLENVEKADAMVQNSLSKAAKTGKFSDSHGRECGAGNAIFVTTSRFENGETDTNPGAFEYSEEDVVTLKSLPIQMIIGFDLGDYGTNQNRRSNRIFMNKRKLVGQAEMVKRAHKTSSNNAHLDLNFPAEEGESRDFPNKWMQDFVGEVDALVKFNHCDFAAIAQRILKDISEMFQKTIFSECSLEIDSRVMIQMVAAAFLGGKKTVEDWVRRVLGGAFEMAQVKYSLNGRSTVKLVAREDNVDQTPPELLPSKITLY